VLLECSDAGGCPAECVTAAQPDFDEHQRTAVAADQVDFAETAVVVGFD
jgi:hypothetical protein